MLTKQIFRERSCAGAYFSSRQLSNLSEDFHSRSNFSNNSVLFCSGVLGLLVAKAKETDSDPLITSETDLDPLITSETDTLSFRLDEVDQLFDHNRHTEELLERLLDILTELNKQYPKNDEVLWRLTRCFYEQSKHYKSNSKDQLEMWEFAHGFVNAALVTNEKNVNAHHWKAILFQSQAKAEGRKAQILAHEKILYHLKRAVDLGPDSTSWSKLGSYYLDLAELNAWINQVCFMLVFSTSICGYLKSSFLPQMPDTSYEQALEHLLIVEEMEPLSCNKNTMLIGKTYLKLKNYDKASHYLERTLHLAVVTKEDREVLSEAKELLKILAPFTGAIEWFEKRRR